VFSVKLAFPSRANHPCFPPEVLIVNGVRNVPGKRAANDPGIAAIKKLHDAPAFGRCNVEKLFENTRLNVTRHGALPATA
jgi:hypothetical protein